MSSCLLWFEEIFLLILFFFVNICSRFLSQNLFFCTLQWTFSRTFLLVATVYRQVSLQNCNNHWTMECFLETWEMSTRFSQFYVGHREKEKEEKEVAQTCREINYKEKQNYKIWSWSSVLAQQNFGIRTADWIGFKLYHVHNFCCYQASLLVPE